jgi:nucleoside-diphosphate-sugar epimerase
MGPSPDGRLLDEDAPTAPITPYGASKLAGEAACREALDGSCPLTVVRPGIVYGPRDKQVIKYFRMVRFGFMPIRMGDQRLSLIHAGDLARLIELAARLEIAAGRTYLATDPSGVWLGDLTRLIAAAIDRRVVIVPVPAPLLTGAVGVNWLLRRMGAGSALLTRTRVKEFMVRYWTYDSGRARQELGWSPAWTIEEGIRDTADWYRQNGWM